MSGFDVEPVELFAAGARASEAAADGHESVARVRVGSADLFAGGWTGAAAAAFGDGVDEWLSGAALLLSGLEELASALTSAGHDYEQAERTNDNTFVRLAS